jgi:YegS/Rv2252/BmrU family lipid kinase
LQSQDCRSENFSQTLVFRSKEGFSAWSEDMRATTVILNPTAGRGAGARLAPRIAELLRGLGVDFQWFATTAPGDGSTLARRAVTLGQGAVVAVGGDGTFNEVLNGLMGTETGPERPALGVIPIGTGNDFAFGAGLSLDLESACRVVADGRTRLVDVGLFEAGNEPPRFFGNGIGVGFDAMANLESRKIKRLNGSLLYLVAVLRTLAFYYDAPHAVIRVDGKELARPSLMISVMNGCRMGGGFYMTPDSSMEDGLLDLCIANKVGRPKMVALVPRFMRGTHTTDRDITMMRGVQVTLDSESPWVAQVDGEIYGVGAQHYAVRVLPQCLRLLC